MPILPIIDLLILMGWTSLFGAFALKAIHISTSYRPALFGMGPMDLVITAGIFLLFAVALAARSWVKAHESLGRGGVSSSRATATLDAYSAIQAEARAAAGRYDKKQRAEDADEESMTPESRMGTRGG